MSAKVATLNIRGKKVDVFVNTDGLFYASLSEDDPVFRGQTFEAVRQSLLRATKAKTCKVSVPFVDPESMRRGVATGIHQKTNHLMVRWADGTTEQSPLYSSLADLTNEEFEQLRQLTKARKEACEVLEKFKATRRLNVRKTVEAAINEELSKPEEADAAK